MIIVDSKPKPNAGATALLFACMENLTEVVARLLAPAHGAMVNIGVTKEAIYNPADDRSVVSSPLSIALTNGHTGIHMSRHGA